MSLSDLWNEIKTKGYSVRKNNLNGLSEWQPLKDIFMKMKLDIGKIPVSNEYRELMYGYIIGADIENHTDSKFAIIDNIDKILSAVQLNNTIESHHFFIQHFRIPFLEDYQLSVVKLLQIAYNAGQFKAESEKNDDYMIYPREFIQFYEMHNLGEIESFIDYQYTLMVPG